MAKAKKLYLPISPLVLEIIENDTNNLHKTNMVSIVE